MVKGRLGPNTIAACLALKSWTNPGIALAAAAEYNFATNKCAALPAVLLTVMHSWRSSMEAMLHAFRCRVNCSSLV